MSSANATKVGLAAVVILLGGIALAQLNRVPLPEGPVPVLWDREVCAHCKMHIGDPRFAAQLQTNDGLVMSFDDPGCLADYLDANSMQLHALYFRDHESDRWLSEIETAFLPAQDSPMGYGIRAVARDSSGAHDWEWARARALQHKQLQGAR